MGGCDRLAATTKRQATTITNTEGNNMKHLILIAAILCTTAAAEGERFHQDKYCKGEIEHILPDRTRVDCLTDTHAIEYDFGYKWAESIGQSLHYARITGKQAGIVIIYRGKIDDKYLARIDMIIEKYSLPITVWTVNFVK